MPSVTVYTRTTCGPCRTLKYWLTAKKVPFIEVNVDADPAFMEEIVARTGIQMVPMIKIGDRYISGLNLPLLSSLLML